MTENKTEKEKKMTAQELANKVVEFIKHNGIDTNEFTMDQIVSAYFEAQLEAISEAGKIALERLA